MSKIITEFHYQNFSCRIFIVPVFGNSDAFDDLLMEIWLN